MDQQQRAFIASSPLLFIASRNHAGHLDVSPRGGQPSVVRIDGAGRLLLPDFRGNRRLDTLGNVLTDDQVALLLVKDGCDHFVRVDAQAEISTAPDMLRAFPADENAALSVLVLTPLSVETVQTQAFARAGFWVGPMGRKPPLDALALLAEDRAYFDGLGAQPVMKDMDEERRLEHAGLRQSYGLPGPIVREKGTHGVGPGSMRFVAEVGLLVVAHARHGRIQMDIVAEGAPQAVDHGAALRLPRPTEVEFGNHGDIGVLAAAPGRTDLLRLNGTYRTTNRDLFLAPREAYLHCTASFSRARIWQRAEPMPWSGRRRFICTAITDEAPDVRSFVLRADDDAPLDPIAPGRYVSVSLPSDPAGTPRRRSYSVSGRPDRHSLRLTIRRIGKGGLSDALHDHVRPGCTVMLGVPAGRFVLNSAAGRPVVLVSAGVGITPLLPMLDALAAEDAPRDVWFVHGARNSGHHLFRHEVAARIARTGHGRIVSVAAYSQPAQGDAPDHAGRVGASVLADLVPPTDADFYICGPLAFMDGLRRGLVELGADPAAIRTEAFEAGDGGGALAAAMASRESCLVTFTKSGKVAQWTAGRGTLLDLAVAEGVDVPHSCRMGDCQSCLQRIVSGRVDHPAMSALDLVEGQALMCQALPSGDVKLEC